MLTKEIQVLARTDMPVNYILEFEIGKLAKKMLKKVVERGKRWMSIFARCINKCLWGTY